MHDKETILIFVSLELSLRENIAENRCSLTSCNFFMCSWWNAQYISIMTSFVFHYNSETWALSFPFYRWGGLMLLA